MDVAEQSFERIIIRLDDGKMFAGRWCTGAAQHSTETAKTMSGRRKRRRIGGRRHIMPLPPSENEPRDDHDQHNLQQQTDDRGEARHATEKAVPEQQAKKTCAEKASSKPAEQAAAEQARTDCRLADGRGAAGLRNRTLNRRTGRRSGHGG